MTWLHPYPLASDLWKLQYSSWTTQQDFFQALQGNNLIFGKFCIWPYILLLSLEYHHRYRNLCNFFSCKKKAWKKKRKKKNRLVQEFFQVFFLQLQKLGLTVMIFFHLILHPTVPIYHIYYSLFHLFSFVVVSVLQSFDAHGKEEKLSPGVYNLVRIKLWCQLSSMWITLFTGEISVITYLLDSNWSAG